jgi:hypothetical protein
MMAKAIIETKIREATRRDALEMPAAPEMNVEKRLVTLPDDAVDVLMARPCYAKAGAADRKCAGRPGTSAHLAHRASGPCVNDFTLSGIFRL